MAAHSNPSQYPPPLTPHTSTYAGYSAHAHHGGTTDQTLPPRFYRDVDPWSQQSYFPCPTNPFAMEVPRIFPYDAGGGSSSGYGNYNQQSGMVNPSLSRKADVRGKNGSWPGIDMTGSTGITSSSGNNSTAPAGHEMSSKCSVY